ncbi:MAG: DMT family transporter [Candidatus Marinimicrobia bacterium]|nr:DMT family transporter [Candidatus Neomarinimicrobiota bacterium]
MDTKTLKANSLLFITAAIWGFAFVAQRTGMEHVGPFLFNGVRFTLGATSLLPFYFLKKKTNSPVREKDNIKGLLPGAGLAGLLMTAGASFQQIGLKYTTAGNAGFITGLYVVIVPIIGIFIGKSTDRQTWIGTVLAMFGMYFLSIKGGFKMETGDLLVLISAFFWASHVQILGKITQKFDSLAISIIQFYVCSLLSLVIAFFMEPIVLKDIFSAGIPILYAGIFSVGIAYTLQVIAQKDAHPSQAAIILSLESVFAVMGGMLFLSETMSTRGLMGCGLMLIGMVLSQIKPGQKS